MALKIYVSVLFSVRTKKKRKLVGGGLHKRKVGAFVWIFRHKANKEEVFYTSDTFSSSKKQPKKNKTKQNALSRSVPNKGNDRRTMC